MAVSLYLDGSLEMPALEAARHKRRRGAGGEGSAPARRRHRCAAASAVSVGGCLATVAPMLLLEHTVGARVVGHGRAMRPCGARALLGRQRPGGVLARRQALRRHVAAHARHHIDFGWRRAVRSHTGMAAARKRQAPSLSARRARSG